MDSTDTLAMITMLKRSLWHKSWKIIKTQWIKCLVTILNHSHRELVEKNGNHLHVETSIQMRKFCMMRTFPRSQRRVKWLVRNFKNHFQKEHSNMICSSNLVDLNSDIWISWMISLESSQSGSVIHQRNKREGFGKTQIREDGVWLRRTGPLHQLL